MIRGKDALYRKVWTQTDCGLSYGYWTRDMPPIPDYLLGSVVYLYPSREAAEAGEQIGGSGFLASVPVASPGVGTPSQLATSSRTNM